MDLVALGLGGVLGAGIVLLVLAIAARREAKARRRASQDQNAGGTAWRCTACSDETYTDLEDAHEHAKSAHNSFDLEMTRAILEEVDR